MPPGTRIASISVLDAITLASIVIKKKEVGIPILGSLTLSEEMTSTSVV